MKITAQSIQKHGAAGILAVLLAALLICTVPVSAAEAGGRTLRVAFPQTAGISETSDSGRRTGLLVQYLNEIAKYTGWRYKYVDVRPEEVFDRFQDGEYDLMGGTYYMEGMEDILAYARYPMGISAGVLLCRWDAPDIKTYDLSTLNGKTIGVYAPATEKIRRLKIFLQSNGLDCPLREYTFQELGGDETMHQRLLDGEVDLLLENGTVDDKNLRAVATFEAQPYYLVVPAGETELLEELNAAIERVMDAEPDFFEEHHTAPITLQPDTVLNEEELAYIADKKELTVAMPRSWHPLYCMENAEANHNGILPDMLKKVEKETNLNFRFVLTDTYAEALEAVHSGRADLLGAYLGNEKEAFQDGLALTRYYARLNSIVMKNSNVVYPGSGLTLGLIEGRNAPDSVHSVNIRRYHNFHAVVEAVNKGEVDVIYGLAFTMEQEMQNHRFRNVVPVSQVNDTVDLSLALPWPMEEPLLLSILNKAIGRLSAKETSIILEQNLVSMNGSELMFQELIYDYPLAFLLVFGLLGLMLIGFVVMVARVKVRNAVMRSELERAEARSRAKSEFLSRMSHEIRTPMNAIVGLTDLTCGQQLPPEARENLRKIQTSSRYLLALINDILDMARIESGRICLDREPFSVDGILNELEEMMRGQAEQKRLTFQVRRKIVHDRPVGDATRLRQVLANLLSNAVKFTPAGGSVWMLAEECGGNSRDAEYSFSVQDTGIGIAEEDQRRIFESFEQVGSNSAKSAGTGLGLAISRQLVAGMGGQLRLESAPGRGSRFYFSLRLPIAEEREPAAPKRELTGSLEGVRVLMAEDNDLNAEITAALLATQGIVTDRAATGREAVERFYSSPPGTYQVILMDLRMPEMDGLEATRQIRGCDRADGAAVPIIAMTANTFREDEKSAFAAGVTAFLPKPVDASRLFRLIRESLQT